MTRARSGGARGAEQRRRGGGRTDLVVGVHAARLTLEQAPEQVLEIWLQDRPRPALDAIAEQARLLGLTVQRVPLRTLERLAGDVRHQGVVLRRRPPRRLDERDLEALIEADPGPALILVLDGVEDPHNLGACLRVADAAGARAVVVPVHQAVGLTTTVRKVACGAAESVPLIQVGNLARTLRRLRDLGLQILGTAGAAEAELYNLDLTGPSALVLGAEGEGLRRLTREHCDVLAAIPMAGVVESLNVSTAAAVCLFEAARQRRTSAAGKLRPAQQ